MKVFPGEIEGLKVIELDIWKDSRGFFVERFQKEKFKEQGLPYQFLQDNHSHSAPGVLRGLHFQINPYQGKLVGVIRGRIWDVAVDIRKDSPTFGKHFGIELSGENGRMLWIPDGFAHGFCVSGDEPADVVYKVNQPYLPKNEGGIIWNDTDLNIPWPLQQPLISPKDLKLPPFKDLFSHPPFVS